MFVVILCNVSTLYVKRNKRRLVQIIIDKKPCSTCFWNKKCFFQMRVVATPWDIHEMEPRNSFEICDKYMYRYK